MIMKGLELKVKAFVCDIHECILKYVGTLGCKILPKLRKRGKKYHHTGWIPLDTSQGTFDLEWECMHGLTL